MAPSPAAGKTPNLPKTPTKPGKNPASSATSKLGQSTGAADSPKSTVQGASKTATNTPKSTAKGAVSKAKETAPKGADSPKLPPRPKAAEQATEKAKETKDDAGSKIGLKDNDPTEDTPGKISQAGNETGAEESSVADTQDDLEEAAPEPVDSDAEDTVAGAKETAEDTADDEDGEDTADEGTGGLTGAAKGVAGKATGAAKDAAGKATETATGTAETAEDTAGDVTEEAGDVADDAGETVEGAADEAGETVEGATDEAEGVADEAGETAEGVADEAGETADGVVDEAGETAEGAADEAGEAVDGVAEEAGEAVDGLEVNPADYIDILKGLEVGEDGQILGPDGEPWGQLEEGAAEDLVGQTINDNGEILDEDGDVVGRVAVLPEKAQQLAEDAAKEAEEAAAAEAAEAGELTKEVLPDIGDLEGLEVGEGGEILNAEGVPLGKIVEGDVEDLVGKTVNEKGEILDEDGDVIGKAEVVPHEVTVDAAAELAEAQEALVPNLTIVEGKKINKKGKILDEDGEVLAQLTEDSDLKACIGKIPNENGEILDDKGNVVGRLEVVPGEAADQAMRDLNPEIVEKLEELQEAADAAGGAAADGIDTSILEGLKVNKKGEVLNEDGEPIARLSEGELAEVAGKKLNDKGEILDKDGNVIGKVEMIAQEAEEAAEEAGEEVPELPPLSILEGLKCNKQGKIVDADGNPVGELIEGDPKKISRLGLEADAEGRFWDNKGNIIGRAQTTLPEAEESEAPFAGLDGLIVVKDGWVEDDNGNRVGQLVEGDPKKLVGRAVDEDGDVIDKRGNVVGHAERYEEPEEEEAAPDDLSILKGLTVNKQGNVIGPQGIPIARLVEGNPKELAGKTLDGEGQIWDDQGRVIGRCELIPENEREAKPEGPFAGLEGLVVVKGGMVEDEDGNVVGQVVEGDPKKLVGRAVDEDGDIIDKYGNVKGHAEPYEEPEEEPADLSILEGKIVNKAGNVVDEHGKVYGRIVSGDPKKLAGKKVDGQGQIWSDDGKVIGQAELIPGAEQERAEGPFSGFEGLVVGKDGVVLDGSGQIVGRLTEGDPIKLLGRKVDEDGDIVDRAGNTLGKAERWQPEEKKREVNPMSGRKVNREGEVRDADGNLIGKLTSGNLKNLIGKEIDDNGYVVDNDGNKIGECTLIENLEEEGPSEEELAKMREAEEDKEVANKMASILEQTLEKIEPVCKMITEHIEKADRTPKDELDEEELVQQVKPLIEEGGKILQECNGAIRGLDPDGHIAANAKARAAQREATPEEYRLADLLKEITTTVVKTIDNAKKRIADMPHAKKELNPLWGLLTEPLFQILAAVGLLLAGVLGLVGRILGGLGLGGLVNGLLGGLGIDKLLGGLGLGSITEALGGGKKKKK